ncbi:zinc finger FYVE domain-containing protein 9 isoform X3 [Ctenocephalides felis]|nr:zinc finger FYVE domain-containing protein 9 isoform X3 [Ctenocephalides felis]
MKTQNEMVIQVDVNKLESNINLCENLTGSIQQKTNVSHGEDISPSIQTPLLCTEDCQDIEKGEFNSMVDKSDVEKESDLKNNRSDDSNTDSPDNTKPELISIKSCDKNESPIILNTSASDLYSCMDSDNAVNYDSISQASTAEIVDAQVPIKIKLDSKTNEFDSNLQTQFTSVESDVIHNTSQSIPSKVVDFQISLDDISDTELENYLQQIENEHNNADSFDNADAKAGGNSVKSSNMFETPGFSDNIVSDFCSYTRNDSAINYDSISQASTVEINDTQIPVGTQEVSKTSDSDPQTVNSCADSITSHPISLSIPPTVVDFQISSAGQTPMNTDINFKGYIETSSSSESDLSKPGELAMINQLDNSVVMPSPADVTAGEQNDKGNMTNSLQDQLPEPVPIHLLGKIAPYWIPDHVTSTCMQCNVKFTVIKRRHHCRACGQVLCSKCCCMKAKLIYLGNIESRVCLICFEHLANCSDDMNNSVGAIGGNIRGADRPNPNNPMEYCSVIPPHQQVSNSTPSPISVMVPIGVLKREGSQKSRVEKTVMFSDGIRPGSDLTKLDHSWDTNDSSTRTTPTNVYKGDTKDFGEEPTNDMTNLQSQLKKLDPS